MKTPVENWNAMNETLSQVINDVRDKKINRNEADTIIKATQSVNANNRNLLINDKMHNVPAITDYFKH